jgi:hypothetical protein
MGEREPDVQRHEAGLRSGAEQHQDQHEGCRIGRVCGGADGGKAVIACRSREQAERQQQRQRAEAGHHQIDVARSGIAGLAMMRHHQRPGRQRHELPAQQIGERVVRQHDQIHAGQERREERQHALRGRFVPAIAKAEETRRSASQIDDDQEERGQEVDAEMRAEPGQPDRQRDPGALGLGRDQPAYRGEQLDRADHERGAVDRGAGVLAAAERDRENGDRQQDSDARHLQDDDGDREGSDHGRVLVLPVARDRACARASAALDPNFSRTPRPCALLTAPSSIISIPAASNAAISLTSESTLPRTIVSLASMR